MKEVRNVAIVLTIVFGFSLSMSGAVRTTTMTGNFHNPSTWDCGCIPISSDDLIVNHFIYLGTAFTIKSVTINAGGRLRVGSPASIQINSFLLVNAGGDFFNEALAIFKKDYTLFGSHTGNGESRFDGNGNIDGNGIFTNNKGIKFNNGTFNILPSADIDFSYRVIQLKAAAHVQNYGAFTFKSIGGAGIFSNFSGAVLNIEATTISSSIDWRFQYPGNEVRFLRTGSGTQDIIVPTIAYDKLTLIGSGFGSVKRLRGNIQVNNELRIETSTLDVRFGTTDYTLSLAGDWNNVSGSFTRRNGTVNFNGSGTIYKHTGFEQFHNVTVSGDHSMISDVYAYGLLLITNTLRSGGYDIHMEGNWSSIGLFEADEAQVIFEGTTNSTVSGFTDFDDLVINKSGGGQVTLASGETGVYETLHMTSGVINTNDRLILRSNAARTGRLGVMGAATFNGDLILQRRVQSPSNDWHLIGSPMTGSTVSQWIGDIVTTGFPGSQYPNTWFNSLTFYDETVTGDKDLGVYGATNASHAITDGQGCRAYMNGGVQLLTTKGAPITGPFTWSNITYTPTSGPPPFPFPNWNTEDGWNLLANPYPSAIDWDSPHITRASITNAIYVYVSESGQFTSYVSGVGTNGGTQYIPSSQAFWVQASSTGTPSLSIVEEAKTDENPQFKNYSSSGIIKFKMTSAEVLTDEMVVRIHPEATMDFDDELDAIEFGSGNPEYPSMGLMSQDGILSSIFSMAPFQEDVTIPLTLKVGVQGTIAFEVEDLVSCPWVRSCYIYDSLEEVSYELREKSVTGIDLEIGEYSERFFLVLNPMPLDEALNHDPKSSDFVPSLIDMYINGTDLVLVPNGNLDMINGNVTIYNSLGQVLLNEGSLDLRQESRMDISHLTGMLIIQIGNGQEIISVRRLMR